LEKARKDARKEKRDTIVKSVYQHPAVDVTQAELGDAVDVSQRTVSNIVNKND